MRTYLVTYAKIQPPIVGMPKTLTPLALIVAPTFEYAKASWESNPYCDAEYNYEYTHIGCNEPSVTVLI